MGSTSCLLISGSYSCCAAVKALAHTATWWTHRETSSGTTMLANPSCTHTHIYIFVQIDTVYNEASELKGSHGRILTDVLNLIVLPEVSNSHRGGHPPLPPPLLLKQIKGVKEEGEGGGGHLLW